MENNCIAILMATYNGGLFIKEQIDSLLSQTYQKWHLYIHDDGSQDDTLSVIDHFIESHPDKITLLDYPPQGGPCKNFLSLLGRVEAPYYMFCDQDDVWLPVKIALTLDEMKKQEAKASGQGVVIHTDLYITDKQLSITYHSMWAFSGIYPQYIKNFNDAGGCTVLATGCTMMFNQKAKSACYSYPAANAIMHDCWVCLCTLRNGGILYGIPHQSVLYRQHGNNCLGSGKTEAKAVDLAYRLRHIRKMYLSNQRYYAMLSSLKYGSVLKYISYKIKYKVRIKKGRY